MHAPNESTHTHDNTLIMPGSPSAPRLVPPGSRAFVLSSARTVVPQPVTLAAPVSIWPVKRRDQDESPLTVTVKSYQPLAYAT